MGHANPPLKGRFLAAVKACGPTAVLSHYSAATLYGIARWDHRHPEVTAPSAKRHRGIHVHRATTIEARELKGIRVTTPARTIRDLSSKLPYDDLRRLTREAISSPPHDHPRARTTRSRAIPVTTPARTTPRPLLES